jgi:hypothetical protein
MALGLRDELLNLKNKLEQIEEDLTNKMMEYEIKAEEWHKRDEEVDKIIAANKDLIISLDIGGKKFQTRLDTLLSFKDTLFYKLIISKRLDITREIFIDRSYFYFHYIVSYLRNKKLIDNSLSTQQVNELMEEAQFYEIQELIDNLEEMKREVKYLKYESSGLYNSGGVVAGTNNIEDLNDFEDKSMRKGICANYPGWITIELNREVEFDEIEVAGWNGNTNVWSPSNGAGASIQTSTDKVTWLTVGTIPGNYASAITPVKVTKSKAKYVKFNHNSYMGIGYFRIKKLI